MMRRTLAVAGLLPLLLSVGCGGPGPELPRYPLKKATLDPVKLELTAFPDGEAASLKGQLGKVVLVDVWATWCKPCRESLPELQALAREYEGKEVAVITINMDDDEATLPQFIDEVGLELPVWRDPGGKQLASQLRFSEAPTSYVIDQNGVVQSIHAGYDSNTLATQRKEIDLLLASPP